MKEKENLDSGEIKLLLKIRKRLNLHPKQILYNLRLKNQNQNELSKYWSNISNEQPLFKYEIHSSWLEIKKPLLYSAVLLQKPIEEISILEIGCNIGTNLKQLQQLGFEQLTGIEINTELIKLIPKGINIINCDITKINSLIQADIIFTSGVLMHIQDLTFLDFIDCKFFITFESELTKNKIIFKRNYQRIFEKLNFHQLGFERFSFNKIYFTRLFRK